MRFCPTNGRGADKYIFFFIIQVKFNIVIAGKGIVHMDLFHAEAFSFLCKEIAVGFESSDKVIYFSLAYTVFLGQRSHDIGGFLTIGQQPVVVVEQVDISDIIETNARIATEFQ